MVLFFCCALYILSIFHRNSPAVISMDLMTDLGFTTTDLGLVSGSTMFMYGLMQMPSGILTDIFGAKKVVVGLTLMAGLAALGFAFSPSVSSVVVTRSLLGIGIAMTVPAFSLLALWFPPESYGRAISILTACGGLGGILAAPPMTLLSQSFGWRAAIGLFGVITLLMAVVFWVCVSNKAPYAPPADHVKPKFTWSHLYTGLKTVLTYKPFWPLCLWQMFMSGTSFMLISLWWVPYLRETAKLSPMEVSSVITLGLILIVFVQPGTAYWSDVLCKSRVFPLRVITSICLLLSLPMAFLPGQMSFPILLVQAALLYASMGACAPLIFTMVKESFPVSLSGTALGCVNMFYPVWTAITQSIFGLMLYEFLASGMSTNTAYGLASLLVVANVVAALACSFFMKETFPKPKTVYQQSA